MNVSQLMPKASVTSCEPGPLYWYCRAGYFLEGEKSVGFIIQPFSRVPSVVVKLKNSFFGRLYSASRLRSFWLSTRVVSTCPRLLFSVMTIGVSRLV